MTDHTTPNDSAGETVAISQDDELRLNTDVYHPHFTSREYVRLGTHPTVDLIFVRPVAGDTADPSEEDIASAYKIDHTSYTGEVTCRRFLQHHNYHHTATTQYVAEWWSDHGVLCVDLTDPVPTSEQS